MQHACHVWLSTSTPRLDTSFKRNSQVDYPKHYTALESVPWIACHVLDMIEIVLVAVCNRPNKGCVHVAAATTRVSLMQLVRVLFGELAEGVYIYSSCKSARH